eukprot:TRINITY_DN52866_c0_g1_i1.p2 TRINITY_DN52866_c0_g1~~TRINITY_DN52866_c0_g1_i1.p2  ORF type:complete len:166 (-),score=55.15 TRINITY_DN52866_c0_g1_i1:53-550(-)
MATLCSLDEFIEKGQLECLNQDAAQPVTNAFEDGDACLRSDTDQQLLVKVQFRVPVKLQSIRIQGPADCVANEVAPTTVKLFQDKVSMGFEEGESEEGTQSLSLSPEEQEGKPVQLRFVKFQNVTSLQIFIAENLGAEQTSIKRIEFFGQPAASMDMKDWKPVKG